MGWLKDRWITLTLLFITFSFFGGEYWSAHWYNKWGLLIAFMAILLGIDLSRKVHWSVGLAVAWTILNGFYVFSWVPNVYSKMPLDTFNDARIVSAMASAYFVFFVLFFLNHPLKYKPQYERAFGWICILESFYVVGAALYGIQDFRPTTYGLGLFGRAGPLGNSSMAGCLIAVTYPFLNFGRAPLLNPAWAWWRFTWKCCTLFLPVVAILLLGSSVPIGVFGVVLCALILKRYYVVQGHLPRWYEWAWTLVIGSTTLGVGYFYLDDAKQKFFDSSGRFLFASWLFELWGDLVSRWGGAGLNLTTNLLPKVQALHKDRMIEHRATGDTMDFWLWLHSDWAQCLFELGVIGFCLYLILSVYCVKRSWRIPGGYFAATLGFLAMMLFNYPMHLPIHAFLGAFLVWVCF